MDNKTSQECSIKSAIAGVFRSEN